MRTRWSLPFVHLLIVVGLPAAGLGQTVGEPPGWRETGDRIVPRVRFAELILDSQPAVLEAIVQNNQAPYTYTVDWDDGTKPESGRSTESQLRLTHDYDFISTFQVTLEVRLTGES